jgi:hypothetical protein
MKDKLAPELRHRYHIIGCPRVHDHNVNVLLPVIFRHELLQKVRVVGIDDGICECLLCLLQQLSAVFGVFAGKGHRAQVQEID